MITYSYIGTFLLSSIMSFILYKNKKHEMDGIELLIFTIFSLIPILNIMVIGNFTYRLVQNYQDKRMEMKEEEYLLNELYQCNACEVYVRKVYIDEYRSTLNSEYVMNVCPICKEHAGFDFIKKSKADKLELSNKIPEQQYMKLKDYKLQKEEERKKNEKEKEEQDEIKLLLELKKKEVKEVPEYIKQEAIYEEIKRKNLSK